MIFVFKSNGWGVTDILGGVNPILVIADSPEEACEKLVAVSGGAWAYKSHRLVPRGGGLTYRASAVKPIK